MKKLKDFFYDYNDIMLAILIIIVAGFVLFFKVTELMAYSPMSTGTKSRTEVDFTDVDLEQQEVENINKNPEDVDSENQEGEVQQNEENNQEEQKPDEKQDPGTAGTATDTIVEIPSGSATSKIASIIKEKGLVSDEKEFINRAVELKLDTKLKAGKFTIPAGSTLDDIIKILSK